GCAFPEHREDLRAFVRAGQYSLAAAALDEARDDGQYGENDELLYDLDRGMLALILGDHDLAFRRLDHAEKVIERNFTRSISADLASYLLNDAVVPYGGEPYEDQYANTFKLLIQLHRGQLTGRATVEALRLADKSTARRDRYEKVTQKLRDDDDITDVLAQSESSPAVTVTSEGEFLESTLGTYLATIVWSRIGDFNNQRVAAQRLGEAIHAQREAMPGVDPAPFADLGRLRRDDASLLVVAFTGSGPIKRAERARLPLGRQYVKIEYPVLETKPSNVHAIRIMVDGQPAHGLDMVEDLAGVAAETYRRQLPMIYLKAAGRTIFKAVVGGVLIHVAEESRDDHKKKDKHNTGDDLLVLLAHGLNILLAETEQADLRSWVTLPGQAYVGLYNLEPGEHTVTIEFVRRDGKVMGAPKTQTITIEPGRLAVVDAYKLR
ncbi:MAG: hypothetical protein KAS72_15330, partial [Phycisphaerales bacterium]|nr:hypothetical protein [Phycisphaerales bacterium]